MQTFILPTKNLTTNPVIVFLFSFCCWWEMWLPLEGVECITGLKWLGRRKTWNLEEKNLLLFSLLTLVTMNVPGKVLDWWVYNECLCGTHLMHISSASWGGHQTTPGVHLFRPAWETILAPSLWRICGTQAGAVNCFLQERKVSPKSYPDFSKCIAFPHRKELIFGSNKK